MALILAGGSSGELLTSPDGVTWTSTGSDPLAASRAIYGLAWSPSLALFVAVGEAGRISTSPDGVAWTTRWNTATTLRDVCWAPALSLFVAVGDGGQLLTSNNGTTWTSRTSGTGSNLYAVTWSAPQARLVAVGASGVIRTSTSGTSGWSAAVSNPFGAVDLFDVTWVEHQSVFLVISGTSGTGATSPTGASWTSRSTGMSSSVVSATVIDDGSTIMLAGGQGPSLRGATTASGSWSTRASQFGSSDIYGSDWSAPLGLLVLVGENGNISTSPDGATWTSRDSGRSYDLFAVVADDQPIQYPRTGTVTAAPVATATQTSLVIVSRTGSVSAAPVGTAVAVAVNPRLGTVSAAPVLSATTATQVVVTGTATAAAVATAVGDVENNTRVRTADLPATPVLTATAVARIVRTASASAAPVATATQTNRISPQRSGIATAAPVLSATGVVTKAVLSGTVTFPNPVASSVSSFGVAIPPGPPMTGQVDLRLMAYAPNGGQLGLLPSPDNFQAAIPLNDIPSLTMSYGVQAPRASIMGQPIELALEVSDDAGATWSEPDDCRFLYLTDGRDPAKVADSWAAEARGYVWRLSKARVLAEGLLNGEGRREFVGAKAGAIVATFWAEAQARGALSGMVLVGDATLDAAGVAWAANLNRTYDVGVDYLTVLMDLAAAGALDFRMTGRTLKLYRPDTAVAVDRTVTSTQVQLSPTQITEAPFRRTWEGLADFTQVSGDEGSSASVVNPSGLKPWGRWESFITQGGVTDPTTLAILASQYQTLTAAERAEFTQGLALTGNGPVPLVDFWPGDFVWSRVLDGALSRYRVRQVTLQKEGNTVQGNVVLNDRFLEQDIKTQRYLDAIMGGAAGAGSSGGIPTPTGPDILQPAAPAGLTGSSATYLDEAGVAWANVSLDWADVTTNADGTAITDLDHYQLQVKQGSSVSTSQWQEVTRVTESRAFVANYVPLTVWTFRVRAVDTADNRSAWSSLFQVTMVADNIGPAQPSTPTGISRLGIGRITWNGLNVGGTAMDADFHHVDIHLSLTNGFSYSAATKVSDLPGAGSAVAGNLTYGAMYYGRLVPYDTSGNAGTPSNQFAMSVAALVDVSNFPDDAMADLYARTGHFLTVTTDMLLANSGAISYLETGYILGAIFETSSGGEFRTSSNPSSSGGVRIRGTDGFRAYGNQGGGAVVETVSIDPTTGLLTANGGNFVNVNISGIGSIKSASSGARVELAGGYVQWRDDINGITASLRMSGTQPTWAADALGYSVSFVSGIGFQVNNPMKVTSSLTVGSDIFAANLQTSTAAPNLRVDSDGTVKKTGAVLGATDSGGVGFRMVRVPN